MSIVLITGANRGIALGLAKLYAARDNTTVIGTARNLSKATELASAPSGKNSKVIVVQYEAGTRTAGKDLVSQLTASGIDHIDILVASGGTGDHWGPVLTTPADTAEEFFTINSLGNLILFQAAYPLLEKSQKPQFVFISSSIASTGDMEKVPFLGTAYGASKAWTNHLVKRVHVEHPNLISYAIHPGWVQTDMGNSAGAAHGIGNASITVDESVSSLTKQIDGATRDETSGKLINYDGSTWSW
ncbi:Norsolorinic acid ketoreductase nor1 [Cladobotryum mycophilum]|uniref:Norsolorinic acid ketoreductase nor1 n=1 Tax=Cladobotryum mycophilum TaxID=491253 RepID=A0ABR0SSE5_9HYPO